MCLWYFVNILIDGCILRLYCLMFWFEFEVFNCGGCESFILRVCLVDVGVWFYFFGFYIRFNL